MKKKLLIALLAITATVCGAFGFTACSGEGKSAYDIAVDNGYQGTVEEWLESLKGTNGTAGTDGTDGVNGKSAYEIAVENGFEGTEKEWLASLKGVDGTNGSAGSNGANGSNGTNGTNGANGKSAYEIAVENGFEGTEEEWLESLKGSDGSDGIDGVDGSDGLSVVCVAIVDNEFVVYFSDGSNKTVPKLNAVAHTADIAVGNHTAEKVTQYGGKYYKLTVPEGESYAVKYDASIGKIYVGTVESSTVTGGNVFVESAEEYNLNALTEGTYYLRVVSVNGEADVPFTVSADRTLTTAQLYGAYRNMSRAIYGNGEQPASMRKMARSYSSYASPRAASHKYDIQATDTFAEFIRESGKAYTATEAAEELAGDGEMQNYFRLPEYCLAQEGFEVGVWHKSDTSILGGYNNMFVKVWYDNDYIYFSYAIRELDLFSCSVLDYDFETGDFYCTIFAGKIDNLYTSDYSAIERHRVYEIAYEDGKFSGYFNGAVYDSVAGYSFVLSGDGEPDEAFDQLAENFHLIEEAYLQGRNITEEQFSAVREGLNNELTDDFALNYAISLDCLDQNIDYAGRANELKTKIEEFPVECAYLNFAKGYLEDLQFIVDNCSTVDSWVHYNAIALYEAIEENLREEYVIQVKTVDDFSNDEPARDSAVYYIFTEYDRETQTFRHLYKD